MATVIPSDSQVSFSTLALPALVVQGETGKSMIKQLSSLYTQGRDLLDVSNYW